MIPEAGYPLELVPPVPLPRRPGADLLQAAAAAAGLGARHRSRSSTGSAPTWSSATAATSRCRPYLAARKRRLPLLVHEQNTVPGVGNKLGARFAQRVFVSFPDTPLRAPSTSGCRSAR